MFDPFNDFESEGYLRNYLKEKDLDIVKRLEHLSFVTNQHDAREYLSSKKLLDYSDFLHVHKILFLELYPWAGEDRTITSPTTRVSKGSVDFADSDDVVAAINEGLRLGQIKERMALLPGSIMGLFAYGHPFLDGNGRVMQLVHSELCRRAGFSIHWKEVNKVNYLKLLTQEINDPRNKALDGYLLEFKVNDNG